MPKSQQLQIRVSPRQKRSIEARAREAGLPVSGWVLRSLLPPAQDVFDRLCRRLAQESTPAFVYAELNDFLAGLSRTELEAAVSRGPAAELEPVPLNYLAAMVEHATARLGLPPPDWTRAVKPLEHPVFASELMSLRLHLLVPALPPFRRRNLFVDSSVGARV